MGTYTVQVKGTWGDTVKTASAVVEIKQVHTAIHLTSDSIVLTHGETVTLTITGVAVEDPDGVQGKTYLTVTAAASAPTVQLTAYAAEEAQDREFQGHYDIWGGDIEPAAVELAKHNAALAGVEDCVRFETADAGKFRRDSEYGQLVTNPPYGERLMEKEEAEAVKAQVAQGAARLAELEAQESDLQENKSIYTGRGSVFIGSKLRTTRRTKDENCFEICTNGSVMEFSSNFMYKAAVAGRMLQSKGSKCLPLHSPGIILRRSVFDLFETHSSLSYPTHACMRHFCGH